jgi:hypothetical protein
MVRSMTKSSLDFYGNRIDQLPTPTTLLLESRKQQADIKTSETKYVAKLSLWKTTDLNRALELHLIEKQAQTFLKDQPQTKHFTLELTIKETKE